MLNGIDPILIFNFRKNTTGFNDLQKTIPIVAKLPEGIDLPAVPLYLSEKLTGIYIDTEEKNIDIATDVETLTVEKNPTLNQRGINNSVKISMLANKESIGLTLLIAMTDFIFPKVTSKEYSITYLHGTVLVFQGYLHSFAVNQDSGSELIRITLELLRPSIIAPNKSTVVENKTNVLLKNGTAVGA